MTDKLKKIIAGVGLLAAFGLGGAAIAGAQGDKPNAHSEATEKSDQGEKGDGNEKDQKVTGADAKSAGDAALKSVGDGKVVSVEQETPDQATEKPEPGEKSDSATKQAIDQKTAYSVEVRKSDGKSVDVALDKAFKVLASEQDNEQDSEGAGGR